MYSLTYLFCAIGIFLLASIRNLDVDLTNTKGHCTYRLKGGLSAAGVDRWWRTDENKRESGWWLGARGGAERIGVQPNETLQAPARKYE